ncbi:MAG: amino acid transporter ATPase [Deltaproteobacteria bacterium]|nr:amino acid transporter ATPase [Deltaproteobacteria bacterium]
MAPLLQIENLAVSYGVIRAVRGVSFAVEEGEVVTLIGANGAGKSSVLRAISGVVPHQGTVSYRGTDLRRSAPHEVVARGVAHVPEGRGIFPNLTVEENLRLAMWPNRRSRQAEQHTALRLVFGLFPRIEERLKQMAGTLSGGEQQMLAVGRALVSLPRLILLDEPSMGLSPKVTQELFAALATINAQGVALLLVEQNAHLALHFASRGLVLENGVVALAGPARDLAADPKVRAVYLGR